MVFYCVCSALEYGKIDEVQNRRQVNFSVFDYSPSKAQVDYFHTMKVLLDAFSTQKV